MRLKAGAHYEESYFKLDNWRELDNSLDDIWLVNEAFFDQQVRAGKEIILSHDPAKATGYFKREVDYLKNLGFKFEQDNWGWKAKIDEKLIKRHPPLSMNVFMHCNKQARD